MRILAVLAVVAFTSSLVLAEEKDKALTGTFTKKAGDFDLKFEFGKKNTFKFSMTNGSDGCEMDAKYTLEKDGTLKCEVTKFEKKGNSPAEKPNGYKFSFKADIKEKKGGKSATSKVTTSTKKPRTRLRENIRRINE